MKSILNKIKINSFTYYFFAICCLCGFIKNALILFSIVIIHELGHIIMIKLCNYEIEKVVIYPFGGITNINKLINSDINKELLIALNGVIFQFCVIKLFIKVITLMPSTINLINNYNYTIILFNLLPIIPLDGSKIIENILNKIFSYKTSFYLTIIISMITIILFFNYNVIYSINNYMIISILIFYTFKYFKDFKYFFNKFLLERIIYNLPYKSIINNTKSINELRKEKKHFFKENNKYINEKEKIKKKFDKNTYF